MSRKPSTTPDPQPSSRTGELVMVDPGQLVTRRNVRVDLHLDEAFTESIAALGVQVPIVAVRGEDGTLSIEHGHRRAAAAAAAGLASVPVVVMDAEQAEATRLMAQVAENQARTELSTAELVAAHEQLALLGVTVEQAAKATGGSRDQVRAARTIAADNEVGQWLLDNEGELQLGLEEIAVLAEFSDDPALRDELAGLALAEDQWEFQRAVEQARADRELEARLADAANEWIAGGWQVLTRPKYDDARLKDWARPRNVRDADGNVLPDDAALLADQPGRAVALDERWDYQTRQSEIRPTLYIADPEAHGYTIDRATWSAVGSSRSTEATAEAKSEERKRVLANNKAWRAAETVRHKHVKSWLATAKPTPAIQRWTLAELLRGIDHGGTWKWAKLGWANDVLKDQGHGLGVQPTASGARASIGTLALVLGAREVSTSVDSWRRPHEGSAEARYLDFLVEHTGYRLSEVEQLATPSRRAEVVTPAEQDRGGQDKTNAAAAVDVEDLPAGKPPADQVDTWAPGSDLDLDPVAGDPLGGDPIAGDPLEVHVDPLAEEPDPLGAHR